MHLSVYIYIVKASDIITVTYMWQNLEAECLYNIAAMMKSNIFISYSSQICSSQLTRLLVNAVILTSSHALVISLLLTQ